MRKGQSANLRETERERERIKSWKVSFSLAIIQFPCSNPFFFPATIQFPCSNPLIIVFRHLRTLPTSSRSTNHQSHPPLRINSPLPFLSHSNLGLQSNSPVPIPSSSFSINFLHLFTSPSNPPLFHKPHPPLPINSLVSHSKLGLIIYFRYKSRGMDGRFRSCFEESVREQDADLDELLEAMQSERREREAELRELVEKNMRHHEEYAEKRRALAREDGPTFFCPPWCSAFENSFLWLGGCRPSLSIRLLYALSGYDLESDLDDLLASGSSSAAFPGGLVGLSAAQLALVNDLHSWTLREENKLSAKMATLQEDVADKTLLPIMRDRGRGTASPVKNGGNGELEAAMEEYAEALARMVEEADEVRVSTTRKLIMEILTPLQAVELLVAAKQLFFFIREWGRRKDPHHHRQG